MFVKKVLKAFAPETRIDLFVNGIWVGEGYNTVGEFMDSELTTWFTVDALKVANNEIVIDIHTEGAEKE